MTTETVSTKERLVAHLADFGPIDSGGLNDLAVWWMLTRATVEHTAAQLVTDGKVGIQYEGARVLSVALKYLAGEPQELPAEAVYQHIHREGGVITAAYDVARSLESALDLPSVIIHAAIIKLAAERRVSFDLDAVFNRIRSVRTL